MLRKRNILKPFRSTRNQPEAEEQSAFVDWLKLYPSLRDFFYSIPNDGLRSASEMNRMKRMGLRKGASDMFIFIPNSQKHGLYIEFKIKPNKPTPEQLKFFVDVESKGYDTFVAYSSIEAERYLLNYLKG